MVNENENSWRYTFYYCIVPATSIVLSIAVIFYLAIVGQGQEFTLELALENSLGDGTAWKWTLIFCLWATMWLKIPSEFAYGAETKFGTRPCIKANGISYYCVTLIIFFLLQTFCSNISILIYSSFPKFVAVLNILGLTLCLCLLIKGKWKPDHPEDPNDRKPLIFDFFRGVELHPRLFGCDIKQLVNVRIPMMCWQLLLCAFYIVGLEKHGFNTASLIHLLIQSVYIAKFFWWEVGYFFSFDMHEREGFFLCWGSVVVVPVLFTFAAAYSIVIPPTTSALTSILIGMFGLTCIFLTYKVDQEKLLFRRSANYECVVWGKPAKYIYAEYKDSTGKRKKSALLTSGFWGLGRHMNYTFELGTIFAFCACLGFDRGLWNFLHFSYLPFFILDRLKRDEEKCRAKYDQYWGKYCSLVPYKMIPGIW